MTDMSVQLCIDHVHLTDMHVPSCVQLSMDHVQVFPDGELNVQAAASRDTSPSFVRPISKAGQHRLHRLPDVPKLPRYTHPWVTFVICNLYAASTVCCMVPALPGGAVLCWTMCQVTGSYAGRLRTGDLGA